MRALFLKSRPTIVSFKSYFMATTHTQKNLGKEQTRNESRKGKLAAKSDEISGLKKW